MIRAGLLWAFQLRVFLYFLYVQCDNLVCDSPECICSLLPAVLLPFSLTFHVLFVIRVRCCGQLDTAKQECAQVNSVILVVSMT